MLFFKATTDSCNIIHYLLAQFDAHLGLKINTSKSQICFCPNTPVDIRQEMSASLGCSLSNSIGIYLGNCLDGEEVRLNSFNRLVQAINNKLQGWTGRFLSKAGRITLIKSILASLSTYYLSHMHVTKTQARKCDTLTNRFLWGNPENGKNMHTISWTTVCKPQGTGGLGIKNTFDLNQSLLAKQVWRALHNKLGLFSKTMMAKYDINDGSDQFKRPYDASPIWKGLYKAYLFLKPNLRWQVGDGTNISIHSTMWYPPRSPKEGIVTVHDLLDTRGGWKKNVIKEMFSDHDANTILRMPTSHHGAKDRIQWMGDKSGKYTMKKGYKFMSDQGQASRGH